ncbi:hypothetical protein [Halobacterium sp. R2-5]|uniref:hypothetical protein n=1 Tax=Halobacterium sp. R2-5 TaxID=2715751 RepID=UPI00141F6BFA|nr:hypothetical protein [Halobacterium sp. R2-5]NIB98536.1 hypothetical protein [Halobacterium sp. R2-5]
MTTTHNRVRKVALLVGCLALANGLLVAHRNPATGYELSPYAATPTVTWVGLAVAFLVGSVVSVATVRRTYTWAVGVGLAVSAALSVFAMPVFRGYTFYGAGDSLTHVGWAREIAGGSLEATNLLYPGVHTLTVFVGRLADVPLTLANTYVVLVAFPLVFLLFVPLAAELLADAPWAYGIGLLAAAAFIPINNISIHPAAHPASQGTLLFAFVLYLALAYTVGVLDTGPGARGENLRRDESHSSLARWPTTATGTGVLLALASAAIVLVHPQMGLNVVVVLGAIAAAQLLARRYTDLDRVDAHRPLYAHTVVALAVFLAWAPRFERVQGAFLATVQSVVQSGPTTGQVVSQRSTSLTTVGGSIVEIFLKLFGPAVVLSACAAALFALAVYRHRTDADTLVGYIAAAFVPLTAIFALVLAGSVGDLYFRYQGFMMVPVTVVAAAALAHAASWAATRGNRGAGVAVVAVVLLVLAPVGLLVVHPSPYVYQPSQHVTESQISGYGSAFDHRAEGVEFTGIRGGPRRYVDYHYGTEYARETLDFPGYRDGVPVPVFVAANYSEAYGEPRYLALTDGTRQTEVGLYHGFRYPASGFRALETTPSSSRVRASEGFELYLVGGDE